MKRQVKLETIVVTYPMNEADPVLRRCLLCGKSLESAWLKIGRPGRGGYFIGVHAACSAKQDTVIQERRDKHIRDKRLSGW
jgi:hypothetical protein